MVDWSPEDPSCPVVISGQAVRDAIYAGITPTRRRVLHARAAEVVSHAASWEHRVAALEQPDEGLAAELERLAAGEAAAGRLALAATRLRWASDISPARADRERRLLTAALHLVLAEESRGLALRPAVEETAPSPLRSCVLGTMAFSAGRLAEAERLFSQALGEARNDERCQPLAALIARRLAGTYKLLGDGEKAMAFGRWALGAGCLDAAAASQARTLVAIGAMQAAGPRAALAELAHLDADPARVGPADVDALTFRGVFRLLGGDLEGAIGDLSASVRLTRRAAAVVTGLRAYVYLTLALYLARKWDDALLTTGQGFSAAAIQARQYEPAVGAPGGRMRARQPRCGRRSRTARGAGGTGRGRPGLRAREGVCGDGPGAGLPGGRRLPGHGRRAGPLARRPGPGWPQPGLRGAVAAAAGRGPDRLGPAGPGSRRAGPAARRRPGPASWPRRWPGWRGGWPSSAAT